MTFDPSAQGLDADAVQERVDDAIADNEVVLFMKGSAMMPQCGYSKRAIGILQQYRDDVETVDALQNLDAFRAALNEHSGWETIPQAFVDGEFIGGSDIIAELDERGELAEKLGVDPDEVENDAATDAPF
ncbi:glutaredoxin [Halosegnis rubeus]|jgi:monothiol glutaredoxin|uniref:Glutaredoxin n=1 Tax=Halosegnis rubeus TaxID=2212850 RepID=A0A5N5UBZ5_9EURY|nr:glutaredoxin family protein [Halosegnis rubeus]KAB7516113.1 glutaredoxin [Halosegnis rubeus]KAB7516673.1 glutaredoxin [Halosegnis rubeus]KAB7520196.1 glutaredoxin [Halosegnis rubeus]